jgi:hypothetical protein
VQKKTVQKKTVQIKTVRSSTVNIHLVFFPDGRVAKAFFSQPGDPNGISRATDLARAMNPDHINYSSIGGLDK